MNEVLYMFFNYNILKYILKLKKINKNVQKFFEGKYLQNLQRKNEH